MIGRSRDGEKDRTFFNADLVNASRKMGSEMRELENSVNAVDCSFKTGRWEQNNGDTWESWVGLAGMGPAHVGPFTVVIFGMELRYPAWVLERTTVMPSGCGLTVGRRGREGGARRSNEVTSVAAKGRGEDREKPHRWCFYRTAPL